MRDYRYPKCGFKVTQAMSKNEPPIQNFGKSWDGWLFLGCTVFARGCVLFNDLYLNYTVTPDLSRCASEHVHVEGTTTTTTAALRTCSPRPMTLEVGFQFRMGGAWDFLWHLRVFSLKSQEKQEQVIVSCMVSVHGK